MNQDKTFLPTIIDLTNEYRIIIEDVNDFETSFFSDVYKQALKHVKEIVEINDSYREKLEDENGYYTIDGLPDAYNNIIVFEGDRGKGKSSAMLSFRKALVNNDHRNTFFKERELANNYNFVSFDVIDPSFFNGDETLFEIIVAKLFHQFEQKLKNFGSNIMDDTRRNLISSFQQVFEDIKNQNNKSNVYKGDALDALIKLSTSSNLRKSFSKLLRQYLDLFGVKSKSNYLILTIDDFDLNIPGMYKMMEDIRRFLINENIIILMSCKFSQVQEATYLEFYNMLFSKVNNIQVLDNIIPKEEVTQKGNKHIQKLIPSNRVNKLKDLAIDYYDFEVNEASRFLKPFSIILEDSKNKKEQIKQELKSIKTLTLNDVKDLEEKYSPSLIIGENFQRAFFKYFYLKNDLFICNRKDYIYGLVPHTFRDLYDTKKQVKGDSFEDYIKDLLINKISKKQIELKEDNILNEDNSFLLFYNFLNRSINFIDNNALVLFNTYFISNIKPLNNIFRPTNGMGLEKINDHISLNNSIPNSWIYSILYGIKDNNNQFDLDLDEILDLYILFFFLKNKKFVSLLGNKSKLFAPTNSLYFLLNNTENKKENYYYHLPKNLTDKLNLESQNKYDSKNDLLFFISNIIGNITIKQRNNLIVPYKVPTFLSFVTTLSDLALPEIFDLEITRILQPDFEVYQAFRKEKNLDKYRHVFEEWFNPTKDETKLYVDLFYNPIFFDLFLTKFKKSDKYLVTDLNFKIELVIREIVNIYPYLKLDCNKLFTINPLLLFFNDKKQLIEQFFSDVDSLIEQDKQKATNINAIDKQINEHNKKNLKNYLIDWPNKNKSDLVINNLEVKLLRYLENNLCTKVQRKLIEQLLLFIRTEIKNRNTKKTKLSDGLIESLDNQVESILNSL